MRDQLIIIDNRRSLHARTDYQYKDRHLVRARLKPLNEPQPVQAHG
jgi:alpha-ketoglutarate-dependent taurine dioxygenase